MKFSEYLSEGIIEITPSMKSYVKDVTEIILDMIDESVSWEDFKKDYITSKEGSKLKTGESIWSRDVSSKYGTEKIYTHLLLSGKNSLSGLINGKRIIFVYISEEDYKNLKKHKSSTITYIKDAILHELIHSVDPRKDKPEVHEKDKQTIRNYNKNKEDLRQKINSEKDPEKRMSLTAELKILINDYYKFPWEIDAYMSPSVHEVVSKILKKSKTKKDALNYLKNLTPETEVEKIYFDDEKIKRRYINSAVKLINKHYEI